MQRIIYSVIFYLALPLILVRLLIRSIKLPAYRQRLSERFALNSVPQRYVQGKLTLWIHAVSVGETVAAGPLVAELQSRYPQSQILVTSMTPTGSDRVVSLFGESVIHSYIPYDLPAACKRFIDKYQPSLLILMETELWPNLIHSCATRNVKLILANARLSEKSAAGYGRFASFSKTLLQNIDSIAAQATPDAERFISLGVDPNRIEVTGSLKFISDVEKPKLPAYFTALAASGRPILIAASTRDGEEEKIFTAFQHCLIENPELLLLLVPRHPERFAKIARLSESRGFVSMRRSEEAPIEETTQVLIGDSMGEMLEYYSVATIAFVGGSLVNTGCQNVLEPAALGLPVVVGPSQFNFATICKQLEQAGALKTVQDENELARFLTQLLADKSAGQVMGENGRKLIMENQNALPALMKLIVPLIQTNE
jgi:3-deoxy-D-manno-octulosonic-acid transferase